MGKMQNFAGATRKDYTGYEKDGRMTSAEWGMWNDKNLVGSGVIDTPSTKAVARGSDRTYYNATHGRFTSGDPLRASATIRKVGKRTDRLNTAFSC